MKLFVVICSFVVLGGGAASATAGTSTTVTGYASNAAKTVIAVKGVATTNPTSATAGPSTLPFTGLDLAVIGGIGVALLGLGAGLRRLGRDTP